MNRLHPRTSVRRLPLRATVITGATLGLLAGAAVFGSLSSAASEHQPAALKPAAAVATAPPQAAQCSPNSTLVEGVCVVRIVRTVVAPATAAPAPAATRLPAGRPGAAAIPAQTETETESDEVEATPAPSPTGDNEEDAAGRSADHR